MTYSTIITFMCPLLSLQLLNFIAYFVNTENITVLCIDSITSYYNVKTWQKYLNSTDVAIHHFWIIILGRRGRKRIVEHLSPSEGYVRFSPKNRNTVMVPGFIIFWRTSNIFVIGTALIQWFYFYSNVCSYLVSD